MITIGKLERQIEYKASQFDEKKIYIGQFLPIQNTYEVKLDFLKQIPPKLCQKEKELQKIKE